MRRGDLVTVAIAGDFGKPRPALVIQSDQFDSTATVTVLLLSSALVEAPLIRLPVAPTRDNGLDRPSQIMVDKAMTGETRQAQSAVRQARRRRHAGRQPVVGAVFGLRMTPGCYHGDLVEVICRDLRYDRP